MSFIHWAHIVSILSAIVLNSYLLRCICVLVVCVCCTTLSINGGNIRQRFVFLDCILVVRGHGKQRFIYNNVERYLGLMAPGISSIRQFSSIMDD